MSEITLYEAQKKKLQGLCDEHDLVYRFRKDRYPITLTISPMQGMDAQMDMLANVEESGYRSPDAAMTWIFEDGQLTTKVTGGTFTISKTLRSKIENVLLKMISFWQQYFFRDVIEKAIIPAGRMPEIDEAEADDAEEEPVDLDEMDPEDVYDVNEYIDEATKLVRAENKASISLLQRRLNVGYALAARIMNKLEDLGVIGAYAGSNSREVLPWDEPDDAEGAGNE